MTIQLEKSFHALERAAKTQEKSSRGIWLFSGAHLRKVFCL